jgi:hypothetical protein
MRRQAACLQGFPTETYQRSEAARLFRRSQAYCKALDVCRPLSLLSFGQALGHVQDGILERVILELEYLLALGTVVD